MLVSVGHRSTLDAFHTHRLDLDGMGGWTVGPLAAAPGPVLAWAAA